MIIHLVVSSFPPTEGGLEKRLLRLARAFESIGNRVAIYISNYDTDPSYYDVRQNETLDIKLLGSYRALLEAPIVNSSCEPALINKERSRMDFLILRNLISDSITQFDSSKHVIVSNFITGCGFLAYNVASELNLPHIPSVVGTDLSRGFRNPEDRYLIEKVVSSASAAVTLNSEHEGLLRRINNDLEIFTIPSSVTENVKKHRWVYKDREAVTLFSDCGYCHKKGTQILLWAFSKLLDDGLNVRLNICGKTNSSQTDYWDNLKNEYSLKFSHRISFYDYLDESSLTSQTLESDIYCYPTLGEGCSTSRATVLCLGMPMVTTNCGEIRDFASDASHVRLSQPGDAFSFYNQLRDLCGELAAKKLKIDLQKVEFWRSYFSVERELEGWTDALNHVTR